MKIKFGGRRAGKSTNQQINKWWGLVADTTRFKTPDGKVYRMARMDSSELGRVVELEEDPHGIENVEFIMKVRRWMR